MNTSQQLIFTPGPVKEFPEIYEHAAEQTPYFRNQQFSNLMLENERMLLDLVNAPANSRVITLTASGTAAMEAAVLNMTSLKDNVLSIITGGFGERFAKICHTHARQCQEYRPVFNDNLSNTDVLSDYSDCDTLLINANETSICHQFDLNSVGRFSKENNILNIVDAISVFLTDQLDMTEQNIDVLIISSQKGIALPPGLAMVVLNPKAIENIEPNPATLYFNFNDYLRDGERGQTPYTPAVSLIIQLNRRLQHIVQNGGVTNTIKHAASIAQYFREHIKGLPLAHYSEHMPNSVTALAVTNGINAAQLVNDFQQRYNMVLCPNGGELSDVVFRVSHMGNVTLDDTKSLISSLHHYFGITQ